MGETAGQLCTFEMGKGVKQKTTLQINGKKQNIHYYNYKQ